MADEARRGELGVALDELEADPQLLGDGAQQRALAGPGGTLQDDVAIGHEGRHHQLQLAPSSDDLAVQSIDQVVGHVAPRSSSGIRRFRRISRT